VTTLELSGLKVDPVNGKLRPLRTNDALTYLRDAVGAQSTTSVRSIILDRKLSVRKDWRIRMTGTLEGFLERC